MIKYLFLFSLLFSLSLNKTTAQSNATLPTKLKTTITLKAPTGVVAQANGISVSKIIVTVDTSIRVAPKNAYLSIEFVGITGSNQIDILNGNNIFWVFDKAGKEIILTDKVLKKVNGSMESSIVNMTVKLPYRLKADINNFYTVHYRWESKDKTRNIDVLTTK